MKPFDRDIIEAKLAEVGPGRKARAMKPDDFAFLAQMVRRRSGLMLDRAQDADLIEGRLAPVMRRFGFQARERARSPSCAMAATRWRAP